MTQCLPPTVCLDGAAVRRIREEKKLTQLYVSKVVGVTTDTISRWENNRYPSIKRENALRLAEALDVPVEEVLQNGSGECPRLASEGKKTSFRFPYPGVMVALLLAILAGSYLFHRHQDAPVAGILAERSLPNYAAPGSVIPVRIHLDPGKETRGFILREHFPVGWKLIEANPPASSLDNEKGTARWIVKPGETRTMIAYLLKVATRVKAGTQVQFSGEVVASSRGGGAPVSILGAEQTEVAPYQWADLNGDDVIDDNEMLKASDTIDDMKGVHLDWKLLENIWDAGGYRWDKKEHRFFPQHPTHSTAQTSPSP